MALSLSMALELATELVSNLIITTIKLNAYYNVLYKEESVKVSTKTILQVRFHKIFTLLKISAQFTCYMVYGMPS